MATTPAVHQVNLPLSYYRREGTTSLPLETRYRTPHARDPSFVRSHTGEAQVVPFHLLLQLHRHNRKDRRQAYSLSLYRRQWNPCHMDFGLVFQQAIDRQDRILQTEGRFSLLELLEIQPYQRNTPTTGQGLVARRHAL